VRRFVEAGVQHHAGIGVDHLERGARHGHGCIVAALDHEFARPDAGRDPHPVERERQRARDDAGEPPQLVDIDVEGHVPL
jgi:hypothetical protein